MWSLVRIWCKKGKSIYFFFARNHFRCILYIFFYYLLYMWIYLYILHILCLFTAWRKKSNLYRMSRIRGFSLSRNEIRSKKNLMWFCHPLTSVKVNVCKRVVMCLQPKFWFKINFLIFFIIFSYFAKKIEINFKRNLG